MADYSAWYRVGTVVLTNGSNIVTGTGTSWLSAGLHVGDMFSADDIREYEIMSIDSDTQLKLRGEYKGESVSGATYRIIRNFTSSLSAETAANATALLSDFRRYVDLDMRTVTGKSAYEVAVAKGYTGTEAQWLESLKAAGEWSTVSTRFQAAESRLTNIESGMSEIDDATMSPYTRNSIYRGKNLGQFTEDHLAVIKDRTYRGMFIGDYFTFPSSAVWHTRGAWNSVNKFVIAGFNAIGTGVTIITHLWLRGLKIFSDNQAMNDATAKFNRGAGILSEDDPGTRKNLYPTSHWYTTLMPDFLEDMAELFLGEENLGEFTIQVAATMSDPDGEATSTVNLKSKVHLPTQGMLTGVNMFEYSCRGGNNKIISAAATHYRQLPICTLNPRYNATHGFASTADVVYILTRGGTNHEPMFANSFGIREVDYYYHQQVTPIFYLT